MPKRPAISYARLLLKGSWLGSEDGAINLVDRQARHDAYLLIRDDNIRARQVACWIADRQSVDDNTCAQAVRALDLCRANDKHEKGVETTRR